MRSMITYLPVLAKDYNMTNNMLLFSGLETVCVYYVQDSLPNSSSSTAWKTLPKRIMIS